MFVIYFTPHGLTNTKPMFTEIRSCAGLDTPHPRPPRWPMGDMERQANRIRPAGQGHAGITGSLSGGGGAT